MYYNSWALRGTEESYPPMEKLAFALITAAYKLKPYFKAHNMVVLKDKPLRRAMSNPEAAGWMVLWVNSDYECRGERMKKYLEQVSKRVGKFKDKFVQIPRKENEQADHLAKVASAEHMLIPNKETPFRLVYRSKVIIPVDVGLISYKVGNDDENGNDKAMCLQLDLVDEVRAITEQRLAQYQDLMAKNYNSRVRRRDFQVGDLILRKVTGAKRDPSQGKLGPNWE
nr:uncharacterized protein LOC111988901 [Quercus suber]